MKNELILSSLLLTAQITPAAMASTVVQANLNDVQVTTFKSPLIKIAHPFKGADVEAYVVMTVEKDNSEMNDITFGKVTHRVMIQLFDKNNEELKDFRVEDSEENGFYAELRGATAEQKTYVLWTCSSTMNCGYGAPGFLHIYSQNSTPGVMYYDLQLPVLSSGELGFRHDRVGIYFESKEKIIK